MGGRSSSFKSNTKGGGLLKSIKSALGKTNFEKLYGKELADEVTSAISKLPDQLREMYQKHLGEITFRNAENGFNEKASGTVVYLNKENMNDDTDGAYSKLGTFFHETGHAFDTEGTLLKERRPSEDAGLKKAILHDYEKSVYGNIPSMQSLGKAPRRNSKAYPEYIKKSGELFRKRLSAEDNFQSKLDRLKKKPLKDRSDLSDILESSSSLSGNYKWEYSPLGAGHGAEYWRGKYNAGHTESEFFANVTDAIATNKNSLKLIKQYYPTAYKKYWEVVGQINKMKKLKK